MADDDPFDIYEEISRLCGFMDMLPEDPRCGEWIDELCNILSNSVQENTSSITLATRLNAFEGLRKLLLKHVYSSYYWSKLDGLLPVMMCTLDESLESNDLYEAQVGITTLFEDIAKHHHQLFDQEIRQVLDRMYVIIETDWFENWVKLTAVEFIANYSKSADRKDLVTVLFHKLKEHLECFEEEEDAGDWQDLMDRDAGKSDNLKFALNLGLGTITNNLDENIKRQFVTEIFPADMRSDQWKTRNAGIYAFSQLYRRCHQDMPTETEQMIIPKVIRSMSEDPHARVRFTAITTMGYLYQEYLADWQLTSIDEMVPQLAIALQDEQNPMIQQEAAFTAMTVINRCRKPEFLISHVEMLVNALVPLVENHPPELIENAFRALTYLASVAVKASPAVFDHYLKYVGPHITNVMTTQSGTIASRCAAAADQMLQKYKAREVELAYKLAKSNFSMWALLPQNPKPNPDNN